MEPAKMTLLRLSLFYLLLHIIGSTPIEEANDDIKLKRIMRDITGQYHPELHGDHAHRHSHAHTHDGSGTVDVVSVHSSTGNLGVDQKIGVGGYYVPPPPPPTQQPGTPNGYANCGCVEKGRCAPQVVSRMATLLQELKNDVVCGNQYYDLCCYDDPWPGPIDSYKPLAPCVPTEYCVRPYGSDPYDVQNYGVIGPCLGLGSVRCLDNKPTPPTGPTTIVVPIYNPPPPPTPAPPTPSPPIYVPPPPPTEPPTTPPPVIYEPPTTSPPVVYEPPPTVYEPPVVTYVPPTPVETYVPPTPVETYVPPTPVETYVPPTPVETYIPPTPVETYEPPRPVETYEPPVPVATYEPPVPVETYEPPVPVETYEPPVPVETYEPPVPVETYEPPTPVETYEPPVPVDTYEPPVPSTDYGVPGEVGVPAGRSYYGGRYPHYGGYGGGYRSRFGNSFWPGYGFGFRKRFHFSKGFFG